MKNLYILVMLLAMLVFVFGCISAGHRRIEAGMSTSELMQKAGPPQEVRNGPGTTEIWVYNDGMFLIHYYINNGRVTDRVLTESPTFH